MKTPAILFALMLFAQVTLGQQASLEVVLECEDGSIGYPPTTGHREVLVRINADWEGGADTRHIFFSVPNYATGIPDQYPIAIVERGESIVFLQYEHNFWPWSEMYWQDYYTQLAFYDNGNRVESPLFIVTTEPAPIVELSDVHASGGLISFTAHSTRSIGTGGWGSIFLMCEEYPALFVAEATVGDEVVVSDTLPFVKGQEFLETRSLYYSGQETEVCLTLKMLRIHDSPTPSFAPQTVKASETVCLTAGSTTTGIDELSANSLHLYPNPARESVTLSGLKPKEAWQAFNMFGKVVASGTSTSVSEIINTEAWSSGVYTIVTKDGVVRLVRE